MSFSTCPIATINAPVERVWSLLSEPANYAQWWDAKTRMSAPKGRAQAAQKIFAQTKALGRMWHISIVVENVDNINREIKLTTMLPFGVTVHNHITCAALDYATCRVKFG